MKYFKEIRVNEIRVDEIRVGLLNLIPSFLFILD